MPSRPRTPTALCLLLWLSLPLSRVAIADEPAAGLVGRWISRLDKLALTIEADGSFEITPPGGKRPPLTGSWEENKGVVVFRNSSDAAVCKDVPGRYRWEMSETAGLTFTLVEDNCKPRMAHMKSPFDPAPSSAE
jgi:hypothetical protein